MKITKLEDLKEESELEEKLAFQMKVLKIPEPIRELKFHPTRKWRVDFAWPDYRLVVEVEGGIHSGGRHVRGTGFEKDVEKYNNLTILGWKLLRAIKKSIDSWDMALSVEKFIKDADSERRRGTPPEKDSDK